MLGEEKVGAVGILVNRGSFSSSGLLLFPCHPEKSATTRHGHPSIPDRSVSVS